MLNAYNIKKIAPRILVSIILLNISIYLVTAAADLTRIVAQGATGLITQPFVDAGEFNFSVGEGVSTVKQTAAIGGIAVGGFFAFKALLNQGDGLVGVTKGIFGKSSSNCTNCDFNKDGSSNRAGNFGQAIHMIFFLVILPIGLIMFAVLITLVFREGLLIFLAMTAPIAAALYILPGTEKYAKKWFELFLKTLLMYPIIMIIFALSDVLASIIFNNNTTGSISSILAGLIAMFAPLALIPFSFKFAGGALQSIYGAVVAGRGKLGQMGPIKEQREKAKRNFRRFRVQESAEKFRKAGEGIGEINKRLGELDAKVASGGTLSADEKREQRKLRADKARLGFRRSRIGQERIMREEATLNKEAAQEAQDLINFGDDTPYRAATAQLQDVDVKDDAGNVIGTRKAWISLAGAEYSEADVKAGKRWMGNDFSRAQQALNHEINKATTEEQWNNLTTRLGSTLAGMGLSTSTAQGVVVGAGFMQKAKTRQIKNTSVSDDGQTTLKAGNMITEHEHTIGTYAALAGTGDDFRVEMSVVERMLADPSVDDDTKARLVTKVKAIADGMKSQIATAGTTGAAYQLAMQQTGQDATPGGAADATAAIEDFITYSEGLVVDRSGATPAVSYKTMTTAAEARAELMAEAYQRANDNTTQPGSFGRLTPADQAAFEASLGAAEVAAIDQRAQATVAQTRARRLEVLRKAQEKNRARASIAYKYDMPS